MNKKLALVSSIASLVLTACASQQERVTASGSYAYVKAAERTHLQVPADLDSPEFSNDFDIPAVNQPESEQLIGRNLEVIPPSLVIPLVSGSHVQEGSKGATVLLDQIKEEREKHYEQQIAEWKKAL
ncbi:outer membrane protein assembly factor BamC, partial [Alteromonas sp. AMM-1]|uniref:outer membrane protein assembly factor BamC n=1 Tax=Alteromonas sp. AMM-1 TaxID=3394233 RepID=UPI0039A4B2F5